MGYAGLTTAETAAGQAGKQALFRKIKDNFDYLYGGATEGRLLKNASFEIDSDADGIPDTWTRYLYPGGTGGFEITSPAHGKQAYKFTHPGGAGNGGGYLLSDYVEAATLHNFLLGIILWSSVAGIRNLVEIVFYTAAKVEISASSLYDSTANPTSPTFFQWRITPPASCRYLKIRITGGHSSINVAGTTYFDGLLLEEPTGGVNSGDLLLSIANAEKSTDSETYIKIKEIQIPYRGNMRIKFDMKSMDGVNLVYGRIYRERDGNEVAIGTERSMYTGSYVTFSEDIGGWSSNDLCQLYIKKTGVDNLCAIRNFQLLGDYSDSFVVTMD